MWHQIPTQTAGYAQAHSHAHVTAHSHVNSAYTAPTSAYTNLPAYYGGGQSGKVFVGGIPDGTTEAQLLEFFAPYGHIAKCEMKLTKDGKARGFGFVTFVHIASVDNLMARKESHYLNGKWIDVKPAMTES